MSKVIVANRGRNGIVLPTAGQEFIPANSATEIEAADWAKASKHPVIAHLIAEQKLVVPKGAAKTPAAAPQPPAGGDTAGAAPQTAAEKKAAEKAAKEAEAAATAAAAAAGTSTTLKG